MNKIQENKPRPSEKVEKPATHFDEPREVVADPNLTPHQKSEALNTLEQDERQLAEASNEGMSGGEPTKLHDVLVAKQELDSVTMASCYERVLEDLRDWQKHAPADALEPQLRQAISSLEKLTPLLPRLPEATSSSV